MSKEEKKTEVAISKSDEKSKGFVSIERSLLNIDLLNDKDKALELFAIFHKGKISKDKSAEDLMVMYVKSRELGIGFASAADHMHVVNGKTGVDIHIIKALLLKAGSSIWWERTRDFEPQYQYTDGSNFWIRSINDDLSKSLPLECAYVYDKNSTEKAKADGKTPVWKSDLSPVDWITTYNFFREIKLPHSKEIKIIKEIGTFSWNEAIIAKLPTNKDGQLDPNSSWQKYRKMMIDHRAFTFGARAIGADLLMGVYETKELLDFNKLNYTIDIDHEVI